jgi:hypothetical protein
MLTPLSPSKATHLLTLKGDCQAMDFTLCERHQADADRAVMAQQEIQFQAQQQLT